MPDNLIQKKGESTWYVRLAIPADVQKAIGCKVRIRSLKTGLRKEAKEASLPYLAQWKAEIAAARAQVQNRKENWKVEVALMGSAMEKLTHKALQKFVKGPPTDLPAAVSAFNEKLARGHADTARKATETYGLTATEVAEAKELLRTPAAYLGTLNAKAVVAITPARLKAFREFRESRGGAPKHVDQQVSKLERLSEFLKQEALPINFDTVDQWLKSLNRAPKTLSQYLMAGTAFWKWAAKYDERWRVEYKDKVNPFTGHELPQGGGSETAGQDREIYTRTDALKLHKAALEKKDQPLADLILLGWYTGGRIEELCKFTKDSVITVDGIPCFDFPRSKSKASKRVVPVHPSLLPTINRLIKDSTDTFLIPTNSHDHYGKRSHAISKAFGRLRTAAGFSKLHVFHGFRHTVVTELIRADVPDALAKELVGHETGSVTHDVYSKGASAAQKLTAISKIPALPI
ncbi:site-specific integrase [Pseudomonas sp. BO3-4]|uniref:site-specific integrase n=1 Tax=Pseudomonas sp. BO3-4 TaxID=3094916 RepID=UPI002A59E1A6|nr:site-specific integrase [Pseudomonas sp. BO3-4]WPO28683.1 site-specific integrase [Pseudomonas sp. BO3-4]